MQELISEKPSQDSYFRRDRYYYMSSFVDAETGWYFYTRGGAMHGPHPSREAAEAHLQEMIAGYIGANDTGGR